MADHIKIFIRPILLKRSHTEQQDFWFNLKVNDNCIVCICAEYHFIIIQMFDLMKMMM